MNSKRGLRSGFLSPVRLATFAALVLAVVTTTPFSDAQAFSVLYNFGTHSGDPLNPQYEGIIAQGRDGNLYSTTRMGGEDRGVVFKITPTGTLTVTYSFSSAGGGQPAGGLTLGTDGDFYGTTLLGGGLGKGRVFKVTQSGIVTVLNGFKRVGGELPYAPPIQGTDGNFYGTASAGGNSGCQGQGCGTVYKITPAGRVTVLHVFDGTHGQTPFAPLVQGTNGGLYGTTSGGGTHNGGTVFKITAAGNLTVVHNFDGKHGAGPVGPLIQGSDGDFYGMTVGGGANGIGVAFKLTPKGVVTVLHEFNRTDGQLPYAGLVQATDGNLYGTTASGGNLGAGVIFRITPIGSYTVLHNFDATEGSVPEVTLFQHTNGILYGDTYLGGQTTCFGNGCGTFFSLDVGLKPFVSLISTSGRVGKTVEVLGQGFTGATVVSFNGTAASFHVVSDTYLTATVPNGATTGFVAVTTPGGTLTSNRKFRVKA